MENPLLSIIVPVYNVCNYIEKCIDSIIQQKYQNFEVFLVDDGSSDGSGEICDLIAERDKRFIVLHKENGGVSSARNMALCRLSGKYVAFLDADDWIDEDIYSYMINKMLETDADVSSFDAIYYYAEEDRYVKRNIWVDDNETIISDTDEVMHRVFLRSAWVWNKIFKVDVLKNIRFDINKTYGEDVDYFLQIIKCSKLTFYVSNRNGYYRLMRDSSATGGDISVKTIEFLDNSVQLFEELKDLGYADIGIYRILISVYTMCKKIPTAYNDEYTDYIHKAQMTLKHPKTIDIISFLEKPFYNAEDKCLLLLMRNSLAMFLKMRSIIRKIK